MTKVVQERVVMGYFRVLHGKWASIFISMLRGVCGVVELLLVGGKYKEDSNVFQETKCYNLGPLYCFPSLHVWGKCQANVVPTM